MPYNLILKRCLAITLSVIFTTVSLYSQENQSEVSDSVNPFPSIIPERVGIKSDKLARFTDQIQKWLDEDEIVGAVVMVIKSRQTILHEAFGWKDRQRKIPMAKHTICRMRSMTKPYVGTSILMLAELNRLSLSDRVSKYLPSYRNEKCESITIQQLLTHTGGFEQPGYPFGPRFYKNLDSLVVKIGALGPRWEPGERYNYSDAGSSTLAYLVTIISGRPVESFIQENILDKLGMSDTFCNLGEEDPRRPQVSCTYSGGKGKWRKYWDNSSPQVVPYFRGSGGMYSTTTDYARFLAMWMDKGRTATQKFLTDETVEQALKPAALSKNGDWGYGYQWEIIRETPLVFGHGGSDGTMALAIPEDDLIFLYFTQSRGNTTRRQMRSLFFEVFY